MMMNLRRQESERTSGNVALMAIAALTLLGGLSIAQFSIMRKNLQQSDYYLSRVELRRLAELGLAASFHDLKFNATGESGNLGTVNWDPAIHDSGADGVPGTKDRGEDDGLPTIGEPSIVPVVMGSPQLGARVFIHVSSTAVAGVQRIVATAFTDDDLVRLEKHVQEVIVPIPRVGAIYVDPNVALDLKGNTFTISGFDTNPDGTKGTGGDEVGISTSVGATPGDNLVKLFSQIAAKYYDQILGLGGFPSLGETSQVQDIDALIAQFQSSPTQVIAPGTYSTVGSSWGNWASGNMVVTYAAGDVHLSGNLNGAGALIVDGDLVISGQFDFVGLVVVRGDIKLTGGGSGTHIWGTLMVKESIGAIDPDIDLTLSGSADIAYSSKALDLLETHVQTNAGYETVYYAEKSGY